MRNPEENQEGQERDREDNGREAPQLLTLGPEEVRTRDKERANEDSG